MGATHTLTTRHCAWAASLCVCPRTVTTPTHSDALRARALPAIVILPREAHGFLARPCRDSLGVATRKPTGLPPYAPPLNPSWRQAS